MTGTGGGERMTQEAPSEHPAAAAPDEPRTPLNIEFARPRYRLQSGIRERKNPEFTRIAFAICGRLRDSDTFLPRIGAINSHRSLSRRGHSGTQLFWLHYFRCRRAAAFVFCRFWNCV